MAGWFRDEGLDQRLGAERVGRARTPATRTTCRPPRRTARSGADELVLLDLWGKLDRPGAVYADITWIGLHGRARARALSRRRSPPSAPRATPASRLVQDAARAGRELRGCEVDRAASAVLREAGYGDHILHRTGHSLGETVHGNGVNMDDYETHDDRRLLAGHRLHDRTGRLLRRLRRPDGNQHDRRAARRGGDRAAADRDSGTRLVREIQNDVHPQDHALLRRAARRRVAGRRHGDRVAARSDARLVGADDRRAADEQRAAHRRARRADLPQHRQGGDADGRQHPDGDEGEGAGPDRLLRRRRRRARRSVPPLLRQSRAAATDDQAPAPRGRGNGGRPPDASRRRAPPAPASSSARTASSSPTTTSSRTRPRSRCRSSATSRTSATRRR